jgi:Holliday junction resolvase
LRRAARRDSNHAAVVAELRQAGVTVCDLAGCGNGVPDLLIRRRECVLLVELKRPHGGRLTPLEQRFADEWGAHVIVARSTEEVIAALDRREFRG